MDLLPRVLAEGIVSTPEKGEQWRREDTTRRCEKFYEEQSLLLYAKSSGLMVACIQASLLSRGRVGYLSTSWSFSIRQRNKRSREKPRSLLAF